MDCGSPGFPVLHYLPEFAETHVHWVSNALQPSHPLLPASAPILSLSQHQHLFQRIGSLIRWSKYWSFSFSISPSNEYSRLVSFKIDCFWSTYCPGDCQESSSAPQFESISFSALSLLYGPTLSHLYMTTEKTIDLTIWTFVGKVLSLLLIHCLGMS